MKSFEALPGISEFLLHHEHAFLVHDLKEQYKLACSNSKKTVDEFSIIWVYFLIWASRDISFPVDCLYFKEEKLSLFDASPAHPKYKETLADALLVEGTFHSTSLFSSMSLTETIKNSEIERRVDEGKIFRLVSVLFETADNKFIKFRLEKQGNDWSLVNKSMDAPYKNWTYEEFRMANLKTNLLASFVFVNEAKIEEFFSYKYELSTFEFVADDENVSVFQPTKQKEKEDQSASDENTNEPTASDQDDTIRQERKEKEDSDDKKKKPGKRNRVSNQQDQDEHSDDEHRNSCNLLHIPYLAMFASIGFFL